MILKIEVKLLDRSKKCSCPEVFCKIGFRKHFVKFVGKRLCPNPFFNKVAGWGQQKRDPGTFCKFCEMFKNTCFAEHLRTSASGEHFSRI